MTQTIDVGLGERTYPIHIGAGVLDGLAAQWADRLKPRRLSIVADETVWKAHGPALSAQLAQAEIDVRLVTVPGGEETKSFPVFADVCEQNCLYPFFDTAYQGFVTGNLDKDGEGLRYFL